VRYFGVFLALALLVPAVSAQQVTDAERQRFEEIKARHDRGEPVNAADREFAQGILQRMNQAQAAARNQDWAKAHPPRESTGLVPLPDLATGTYQGEEGGLYPGGKNTPPEAHLAAGVARAKQIAASPKVVLLSIGMSNTTQEFTAFQRLAAGAGLSPKLVLVDGAQGGQTAQITANPQANFWRVVDERLVAAGVTAQDVQAVWLKQANAQPNQGFPAAAKKLEAGLVATLHNLHERFPNLKICYLSSRIYGGYAGTPLNPEPYAYEGGFAVKWTIARQISGDPELNYDPAKGAVRAPWIAWGPYLWADGVKGRKLDGVVWLHDDLGPDGTHPSDAGRRKVARQLLDFLRTDPTANGWVL
jgi:lysophospholipase L1-like esterase